MNPLYLSAGVCGVGSDSDMGVVCDEQAGHLWVRMSWKGMKV